MTITIDFCYSLPGGGCGFESSRVLSSFSFQLLSCVSLNRSVRKVHYRWFSLKMEDWICSLLRNACSIRGKIYFLPKSQFLELFLMVDFLSCHLIFFLPWLVYRWVHLCHKEAFVWMEFLIWTKQSQQMSVSPGHSGISIFVLSIAHRLPIFYSNVYSMVCFIKKFFFDNLQNKGTPDLEWPEFNYRLFECAWIVPYKYLEKVEIHKLDLL